MSSLDRRTFQLAQGPVEVFMSFALHQRIMAHYGSPQEIQLVVQQPVVQAQIVAMILLGKDYPRDEVKLEDLLERLEDMGVTMQTATEVLDWFMEHCANFFQAQVNNLSKQFSKVKQNLSEIEKQAEQLTSTSIGTAS